MNEKSANLAKLPQVRRAREYRLYLENGTRLIDMYLDGGVAICGHRYGRVSLHLKNAIASGVLANYPTKNLARFKKALKTLYPTFQNFYIFSSIEVAKLALAICQFKIVLPLQNIDSNLTSPLVIKIPFPSSAAPAVVALPQNCNIDSEVETKLNSLKQNIAPFLLSGATRAIYDFILFKKENEAADFSWFSKSNYFEREGCFLHYIGKKENYEKLFCKALAAGILISPASDEPTILPFVASDGEKQKIIKTLCD